MTLIIQKLPSNLNETTFLYPFYFLKSCSLKLKLVMGIKLSWQRDISLLLRSLSWLVQSLCSVPLDLFYLTSLDDKRWIS